MIKLSVLNYAACFTLGCLPILATAATPEASPNTAQSAAKPFSVSCKSEDFRGEAKGIFYDYGFHKSVYLKEYRITKTGGSNRHQANVNMTVADFNGKGSKKHNSTDSMKQDGQWHAINLHVEAPWRYSQVRVEIIFDKSGADTKCTSRVNI